MSGHAEKDIMDKPEFMAEHAPWPVKHAPQAIKDVVLNKKLVQEIIGYVNMFRKNPERLKYRALLLIGPPGVGKTSMAKAIARSMHLELLEVNASDDRSKDALLPLITASQTRDFQGMKGFLEKDDERLTYGKLLLIDEVDGLSGTYDRGGLPIIIRLIRQSRYPMLLTANDPTNDKIRTLLQTRLVKKVEFKKPDISDVVAVLSRIAEKEGLKVAPEVLHKVAELSYGDIRASINNFQTASQGKTTITMEDVLNLDVRDREVPIEGLLDMVFCQKDARGAHLATTNVPLDYRMFLLYFAENTYQYATNSEELVRLYEWVTKADQVMARIRKRQYWSLLRYFFEYLTTCMALTKNAPTCGKQARFPLYLVTLSKSRTSRQLMRTMSEKIAKKCHVSPQEALMNYIPVLLFIFQKNTSMAADLSIWFEFFKLEAGKTKIKISWTPEIEFLAGSKERAKKIQAIIKKRIKDHDLSKHEAVEAFTFISASPIERQLDPSLKNVKTKDIVSSDSLETKSANILDQSSSLVFPNDTPEPSITPNENLDAVTNDKTSTEKESTALSTSKKEKKAKKAQKSLTDFFG